jgi:hypothetical protein
VLEPLPALAALLRVRRRDVLGQLPGAAQWEALGAVRVLLRFRTLHCTGNTAPHSGSALCTPSILFCSGGVEAASMEAVRRPRPGWPGWPGTMPAGAPICPGITCSPRPPSCSSPAPPGPWRGQLPRWAGPAPCPLATPSIQASPADPALPPAAHLHRRGRGGDSSLVGLVRHHARWRPHLSRHHLQTPPSLLQLTCTAGAMAGTAPSLGWPGTMPAGAPIYPGINCRPRPPSCSSPAPPGPWRSGPCSPWRGPTGAAGARAGSPGSAAHRRWSCWRW